MNTKALAIVFGGIVLGVGIVVVLVKQQQFFSDSPIGQKLTANHADYEEPEESEEERTIDIKDGAFVPNELTVTIGQALAWHNEDTQPHTIVSSAETPDEFKVNTGPIAAGARFTAITYTQAGTYTYTSSALPGVVATVVVVE